MELSIPSKRVKADLRSKQVSYDHLLFDGIDPTATLMTSLSFIT